MFLGVSGCVFTTVLFYSLTRSIENNQEDKLKDVEENEEALYSSIGKTRVIVNDIDKGSHFILSFDAHL